MHVSTDVPYRTQAEVDEAAKALADELAAAFAEFEGVARGNPKIRAGAAVTVNGLGEPFDGKYTVTTSRHRFDPTTGYTTSFSVTGRHDRTPARPGLRRLAAGRALSPAWSSPRSATPNDPEKAGRVKLTFPWLSDDYVSDWARTVQPGAGKDRGGTVLPEVGDEVLVAFEQGDFRRPYVLGGLYNGVDTLPSRADRPDRRRLGCGQPAVDGLPATATGSTCWTRTARPRASRWPPRTTSCSSSSTTSAPRSPCTPTARS